jgi:hypothetical protein
MPEEKKGIVSAFACMVKDCGSVFVTRSECWQHMEAHGLRAYFAPTLVILEPEPAKPVEKPVAQEPQGDVE